MAAPNRVHVPKKATMYSAILPGAGTVYNRKNYWKIPIVYGALGAGGYFIVTNHKKYRLYKNELIFRIDNGAYGNLELDRFSNDNLFTLQDQYRRMRDFSVVLTAVAYVVQIVDATVDAHFVGFDVSEDLSLRIKPIVMDNFSVATAGVGLVWRPKGKASHKFLS